MATKFRRICMTKTTLATHAVTLECLEWFSIQTLVNLLIFKRSLNLSLTHSTTQIACHEEKEDLSPIRLKEIFYNSLKISNLTRVCMENQLSMTGWQELFFQYKSF